MTAPHDDCPSCGHDNNPPMRVTPDSAGALALYRCNACLTSWRSAWANERPGEVG